MLLNQLGNLIEPQILEQLRHFHSQILKGNEIQTSSSNMLLLNVEDILGFAQLKAGKFSKIVKKFNIKRCIEEIISIQIYQAKSKNIDLSCEFLGFPVKKDLSQNLLIESDEKRIKQVLMNLQSNALKFTKDEGAIKIVCTYIKAGKKRPINLKYVGHDSFSSEKSSESSSDDSESSNFRKEHLIDSLYDPDPSRAKIVIQVIDSGIGIKKKDKVKLFKLFGCLQNTRQMNT
jgi:signal transduction histidine kinase